METLANEINKIGGVGASEVGKLFTKAGLKAKTAQTMAYEKALEIINGYRKNITTVAMQHGLFNEDEAYRNVIKPVYQTSTYRSDVSIPIADGIWVTPDVIDDFEGITFDIKCPYTIYTYYKNLRKLPETYIAQNQMQMIGTNHENGFIVLYLTSNAIDEYGNKIEYDIPIEKRHAYLPIKADKDFQDEILKRINEFFPMRDMIMEDLINAINITDIEYFNMADKGKKITRFKDKSNLLTWSGKIYHNKREGYIVIE